ncbi:MAG: phosphotransferase [Rhodobacteraceae bacterium]|nr:phosphotransferase [Paracoccaceae bacterium]
MNSPSPTPRTEAADAFLIDAGWSGANRAPLAGDASNRRYERVRHPEHGDAVLMDAPPNRGEDVRPFAAITELLRGWGFSAPQLFAADADAGFLLLEDLGDDLYARVVDMAPSQERALYARAIDALAMLKRQTPPQQAEGWGASHQLAPYNAEALLQEAALAVEWWTPAARGAEVSGAEHTDFLGEIDNACAGVAQAQEVLTLRDYHAENLIWRPERAGVAAVGLLDYQDALVGHPAYDLASLLEDARRDVAPDFAETLIAAYLVRAEVDEPDAFRAAYAALAAQRNLKIIGIFARLWLRDGKKRYLAHIPRVWRYLEGDLAAPGLESLRGWVSRHIPAPTPEALARVAAAKTS